MNAGITIIVPVLNRADIVTHTLDSVAAQTYRPLRLIIVDNNSTDNTPAVVHEWAARHADKLLTIDVLTEPHPGAPAARNAGLKQVRTEWTMFFDSDDTMEPDHVANAMACAKNNPRAKIVGWPIRMHRINGDVTTERFDTQDVEFHCIQHGSMATQRYMARTELFLRAGGWRNDVRAWNDIELGIRLLRRLSSPAQIVSRQQPITVDVMMSADSITGADFSHNCREYEHALDCIEANIERDKKWIVDLKRAILAGLYAKEGNQEHSSRLMHGIKERNRRRRAIYKWACNYTSAHGRGAASMLRPLFRKPETLWESIKSKILMS